MQALQNQTKALIFRDNVHVVDINREYMLLSSYCGRNRSGRVLDLSSFDPQPLERFGHRLSD
jgi:hypothetical protein